MTRLRALVVEDDALIGACAKRMLANIGCGPVSVVSTGEAAVKAAIRGKPNVILMDVNLGAGIDGLEASARIRESLKTPIILTTGYDPGVLDGRSSLQPCFVLTKPYTEGDIKAMVGKALGGKAGGTGKTSRRGIAKIHPGI